MFVFLIRIHTVPYPRVRDKDNLVIPEKISGQASL